MFTNEVFCDMMKEKEEIVMKSGNGSLIGLCTVLALLMIGVWSCSSSSDEAYKKKEIDAWNSQMHKSPSSWTQEERTRYNNFMDWLDKQHK